MEVECQEAREWPGGQVVRPGGRSPRMMARPSGRSPGAQRGKAHRGRKWRGSLLSGRSRRHLWESPQEREAYRGNQRRPLVRRPTREGSLQRQPKEAICEKAHKRRKPKEATRKQGLQRPKVRRLTIDEGRRRPLVGKPTREGRPRGRRPRLSCLSQGRGEDAQGRVV